MKAKNRVEPATLTVDKKSKGRRVKSVITKTAAVTGSPRAYPPSLAHRWWAGDSGQDGGTSRVKRLKVEETKNVKV